MPVAIYARVSTEEQRERQSIVTQQEFGTRYCELHQWPVCETYADDGVSGTLPVESRPAGARMLEDARRGRFDQLLVFKLDRLGRETRLILNAVAELEKRGVRVRSMTEEFDTSTATGKLMLTMLSGFAAHERESIRERSVAGTNRLAEAGSWLGGIVPYGYRQEGEHAQARLVVKDTQIPGLELSEADVVCTIFRMVADEKKSCLKVAAYLNSAGIPCGSNDSRRRTRRTATHWRPARVRNLIKNPTYKGQHLFGRRSANRNRKIISREVPAIVSEATWQAAQEVLRSNRILSKRNTKQVYLLRGLIKCGLCGLTFCGTPRGPRQPDWYYCCNGRHGARGLYGLSGQKCAAKILNGDYVERLVWADIEAFLRNPGELLEALRQRLTAQDGERERRQKELADITDKLKEKSEERDRVLGLFRRGRIDEATLDRQLDEIEAESAGLRAYAETLTRTLSASDWAAQLASAESLLTTLRSRLDGPIPPELKRTIIELLVESVQANTVERSGVKESELTITYRFSQPHEPAVLVLPRAHRVTSRTRAPEQLNTIGDHIRRRRLTLKLMQKELAKQWGVKKETIWGWENNRSKPETRYMPGIIEFLGYNPLATADTWAERLVGHRTVLGLTQREAAARIGVDPGTLAKWERGEREPEGKYGEWVRRFVSTPELPSRSAVA